MTDLSDEAIEAFFLGDAHDAWEGDEALAGLADHVLTASTGPAPRPGPALLAFLGQPSAPLAAVTPPCRPTPDPGRNVVPLFRRLRMTVGIAAAAGVAAATLAVAGTTGVLPEPAMRAVSWVVEAVTPIELREPARTTTDRKPVPPGPTSTVRPGPVGDPGPAGAGEGPGRPSAGTPAPGQGEAPGPPAGIQPPGRPGPQPGPPAASGPAGPPVSVPAGNPGAGRPPGAGGDQGRIPPATFIPLVPAPQAGLSPPSDGSGGAAPIAPVDRPGRAPGGGADPPTGAGPVQRP